MRTPLPFLPIVSPIVLSVVLPIAAIASACAPSDVVVEVLPPRTGVTCSAPAVSSSTFGRGLHDLGVTELAHGAYVADLRLTVKGADARVDGIRVAFTLPDGASADAVDAATDFADGAQNGDVFLVSKKDDDVRQAVVENIVLLPRSLATALRDSVDVDIDDTTFAPVGLELTALLAGSLEGGPVAVPSTFQIDVCDGCLVTPPQACPDTAVKDPVCRPGQDVALYSSCPIGGI